MFQRKRNPQAEIRRDCPYLDTVNRHVLDFDFSKSCSVSNSKYDVYACLVCGKYYRGKGLKSHAYNHSLEAGHYVYVNLQTEKFYCLPDGYEIDDPSLDDIQQVLNPRFSKEQVEQLDKNKQWSRALNGSDYLPGMVGLNNMQGNTDFVNVIIHSFMRVTPLRNFFLMPENYQNCKSDLVRQFGELTRKIWHARNFKGQVSPHEFLREVMKASGERFGTGAQSDPVEFMAWLLDTMHADLRSSANNTSIIYECFKGELEVVKEMHGAEHSITEALKPSSVARMRYRVTRLPQYLIIHMDRFKKNTFYCSKKKKNGFFVEKNPILVNFPVKNLELKDYIPVPAPKENAKLRSKYDLVANVVHDGKPGEGVYRTFVQRKSEELWYEMQDLRVAETLPQMVALSETYMQIYEQQQQQ
ncbi:hypothetical protein MKW94_007665 [Papaver nudicaule]|uniref:U4/U6.U5 tri-snRNP-associated protein 2 n=1 Tax=Papaver nudicaule TaxID=74823 RepID=A0AA42B307_PAPNU|nr:hypothetical protein [Papaver nudicaule]